MPRYKCKAKDMEGNVYKGVMEAADERVLLKVLRDKGLYCFECRGLDSGMALRPAKIKHKLLPPLCRQLSAMLAAGVPLSRALAVSYESAQDGPLRDNLMRLRESIHKGCTLFEAMEGMPGVFPNLLVYMIQTGESSGKLDVMLGTMAEYYDREEEMNGKVRAAMTYPVILLGVTIVSSVFMLTTVLPQFASMMKEQVYLWAQALA